MITSDDGTRRRLVLLGAGLAVAASLTLFARVALDIAIVFIFCAIAFLLERTVGDWLSDVLGARLGTLLFAAAIAGFLWLVLLTGEGRSVAERLLATADDYGFHTMFLRDQIVPPPSARGLPGTAGATDSSAPRGVNDPSVGTSTPPRGAATVGSTSGAVAAPRSGSVREAGESSLQVQLELGSARARVGQRIAARATVRTKGGAPRGGVVVFTVNGAPVQAVELAVDGSAAAQLVQQVAGRYQIRAEYRARPAADPVRSGSLILIVD